MLRVEVGLAIAGAGVALFVLYAVVHRRLAAHARHVHAGPATSELRTEPPAVVNLLVNELTLTPDAVAATVLDLAAGGYVEIVEVGPQTSMLRVRHPRGGATGADAGAGGAEAALPDHQRQLLELARGAAADGDMTVAELTAALGPGSVETWGRFSQSVRANAVELGLVRRAGAGKGVTGPCVAMATAVSIGLLVIVPPLWLLVGVVWPIAVVAGIVVLVWGYGQLPTAEGRAAAAHWLGVRRFLAEQDNLHDLPPAAVAVWDRYLAYGAAMGESPAAVHGLGGDVRTRMSLSDWNRLSRLARDPQARAAQMRTAGEAQLSRLYGGAGAGALGPDDGDFWTLVERTARGWSPAMMALAYDAPGWAAAVDRRLAALQAAAPADLAAAIAELAPTVKHLTETVTRDGVAGLEGATAGVDLTGEPLAEPVRRLLVAAGQHFGCPPDPESLARRLGVADPYRG
ncbi:MAG TPA: hypothetical protein VHT97_04460 [Acidimicrobiales bacterium]|nr:hypothetical protein [Acidimicrobiales bacterium]